MSKSNLSADAQCFVPSPDNTNQKLRLNNCYGDNYNYFTAVDYSRPLYDVSLCPSHNNRPYIVPVFGSFYPNERFHAIHSPQIHQENIRQKSEINKSSFSNSFQDASVNQSNMHYNEKKEGDVDTTENLHDGKVIMSKSTKKRKAKKNKLMEEQEISKASVVDKQLTNAFEQDSKEGIKLTKSWSEVVTQGSNAIKRELLQKLPGDKIGCQKELKPSINEHISEKTNKCMTPRSSTFQNQAKKLNIKSDSGSNNSMRPGNSQNKKIRVLNRTEKLEDIEEVTREHAGQKKDKIQQLGKPGRSKSSDPLQAKKHQIKNKATKLTDKPITLDIFEMISLSKKSKDVKADAAHIPKDIKSQASKKGPNILDSSAVTKRGKEREVQKPKKPTKLRKVILKDRMLRRSKFLQSLGLLETRSLERLNVEYDLPLIVDDDVTRIEFPSHKSALEHLQDVDPRVLSSIHSRRFREYCNQVVSKEINECCTTFLKELVRFQDNQFHRDPVKARIKKRLVFGLREVLKFLGVKKIKCVIISPNVEKVQSEGGLEEKIEKIITSCQVNGIPFVFALSRRQLGFTCFKKVPVSVVGILNYDGAEVHFKKLKELTETAREKYHEMVSQLTDELANINLEDNNEPDVVPKHSQTEVKDAGENENIEFTSC